MIPMKLSDLEKKIQELKQQHGDLEVFVFNPEYDEPYLKPSLTIIELVDLNGGIQSIASIYKKNTFKALVLN